MFRKTRTIPSSFSKTNLLGPSVESPEIRPKISYLSLNNPTHPVPLPCRITLVVPDTSYSVSLLSLSFSPVFVEHLSTSQKEFHNSKGHILSLGHSQIHLYPLVHQVHCMKKSSVYYFYIFDLISSISSKCRTLSSSCSRIPYLFVSYGLNPCLIGTRYFYPFSTHTKS